MHTSIQGVSCRFKVHRWEQFSPLSWRRAFPWQDNGAQCWTSISRFTAPVLAGMQLHRSHPWRANNLPDPCERPVNEEWVTTTTWACPPANHSFLLAVSPLDLQEATRGPSSTQPLTFRLQSLKGHCYHVFGPVCHTARPHTYKGNWNPLQAYLQHQLV